MAGLLWIYAYLLNPCKQKALQDIPAGLIFIQFNNKIAERKIFLSPTW